MPDLPPPGSTLHRVTARVLPVNAAGRVLLLHGWEPRRPERTFWFTIGGAVEDGEELTDAAVRELAEEVGITAEPAALRGPIGTWPNAFTWGEWRICQQETWYAIKVGDVTVTMDGQEELEQDTIDRAHWWTPDELDADGTAVIPEMTERMRAAINLVR